MVADRPTQLARQFLLEEIEAAQAVEGIDFVGAIALGFDIGIAGHLGDPGGAAVDAQGCDHVGVATTDISSHEQDVLVANPTPGGEWVGNGLVPQALPIEQIGQRFGQE